MEPTGACGVLRRASKRSAAAVLALVTATTLAVTLASPPAPAAGAPVTEDIETACNNTFQPSKFPLTYRVKSTPSANPVAAGSTFTVEFQVSLVASASFLNGLYDILGKVAVPITQSEVTIAPLTGATGGSVRAVMANPFTIPAPGSIPVSAGVVIPVGTVTGTFTATTGTAKFQILGNAWAPSDTLPAGTTQAGWTGSAGNATLTTSGARTFAQASLAGGVIEPYLVCMGGAWTASGTTYAAPLKAPTGFGAVTVAGATTTSTTGVGSTTTTTTNGSTTSTTVGSTSTMVPATTTTSVPSTTTSTLPSTSTTLPPPEAKEVTGSATYPSVCTTDITPDEYPLSFTVEGTTRTNIRSGDLLDIVDQTWSVTVPGDLLGLMSSVAGKDSVDALITPSVNGKNTSPASVSSDQLAAEIGPVEKVDGVAQPLTVSFRPGDVRFQVIGGNAEFRMGTTTIVVSLNDALDVTLTCVPVAPSEAFVISVVSGPPVATTTTVVTATSDPTGSGGTPTTSSGSGDSGTLARTGADGRTLLIEALAGLLLLQLGYLFWSVVAPTRPARFRTRSA